MTPRTKAIVAVHLYGQPADMDALQRIADSAGVALDRGRRAGARRSLPRSDAPARSAEPRCFSFYPSKNLGAFGDAGAVVTNDPELAERIRILRDLGQVRKYEHVVAGHNERLDTLQAAVLRRKLPHLDAWNDVAARGGSGLRERARAARPRPPNRGGGAGARLAPLRRSARPSEIVFGRRSPTTGVATGLHYPLPLHLEPVLACLGYRRGEFPVAEDWSLRGFSLPMFAGIEQAEIDAVCRGGRTRNALITPPRSSAGDVRLADDE